MLKLKRLIPAMLSVIFAFAICTTACKDEQGATIDQNALVGINLVTNEVKKSYELGEQFTSENLVVNAVMKDIDSGFESTQDVSSAAKVDSSEFDANKVGTYAIFVCYSHAGVTRSDSYDVTVNASEPVFGGITVEYAEGVETTKYLEVDPNGGISKATIPQDKLIVKKVNTNGEVGETLPASEYNVDLYLGTVKQSSWTVGGGAYTLLVSLKSDPKVTNFVNYYVVDQLSNLQWDQNAAGTVTQIDQWSTDYAVKQMAATWQFKAWYVSGAVKTVTTADAGISYTCNVEENGPKDISVTYTDVNAIGEVQSAKGTVKITVNTVDADTYSHTFDIDALKAVLGVGPDDDSVALAASHFTGVNSFLKFIETGSSTNDQYRQSGCFEIKGDRLEVTFEGKGYIEIGFSSTGGSNISGLVLKNAKGDYVYGSVKSGSAVELLEEDDYGNLGGLFIVSGTTESVVKFSVEEKGTYTIYSNYSHSGGSRGCRIWSINMVDVVLK